VAAHDPGTRIMEILDPYLADEAAHKAFRVVQRVTRARHKPRHLVYTPREDRAAVATQLWKVLSPRALIVLRSDEPSLAGIVDGSGRHAESQGVELTIHEPAAVGGRAAQTGVTS
jgi:hypothetical protein